MLDLEVQLRQYGDYLDELYGDVHAAPAISPLGTTAWSTSRTRRVLLVAASFITVLAITFGGWLLIRPSHSDLAPGQRPLPRVDPRPLFPDVVPHQGPELLLAPAVVPAGYSLLYAGGPDARGIIGNANTNQTTQTWVKLDPSGRALAGFTLSWEPQNPANLTPLKFPDTQHVEPLTINGHRGVWVKNARVIWEQNAAALSVSARNDEMAGRSRPEMVSRAELEAIARSVIRRSDGTYAITRAPTGFRLAGTSQGSGPSGGTNERRLVYADGQGHGFVIQLMDDTQQPPGVGFGFGGSLAELVTVRGQPAVQTPALNGGDGSGCLAGRDMFLCTNNLPPAHPNRYLQWLEPDSTRVTLSSYGLSPEQLLAIAQSLTPIRPEQWNALAP